MSYGDISDSVFCVGMACAAHLPAFHYTRRFHDKTEEVSRRPDLWEVDVYSFPQTWASTALGFGGLGGQSFTTAQTTVVIHGHNAAVYFSTRLAYVVENFRSSLMEDIGSQNMAECGKQSKYRTDAQS